MDTSGEILPEAPARIKSVWARLKTPAPSHWSNEFIVWPTIMEDASLSRRSLDKKKKKHRKKNGLTAAEIEERRLKKEQRRALKVKQHMAELGLDEHGNPLDNYSLLTYPVRECQITVPFLGNQPIALNPVVTLISVGAIWSIVLWNACKYELLVDFHIRLLRLLSTAQSTVLCMTRKDVSFQSKLPSLSARLQSTHRVRSTRYLLGDRISPCPLAGFFKAAKRCSFSF